MDENEKRLENLFQAARQRRGVVPKDLMARMISDASKVQGNRFASEFYPKRPILSVIVGILGGWRGVGGLATACAAGVWIGLAPPAFLPDPVDLFVQNSEGDLMAELGLLDLPIEEE